MIPNIILAVSNVAAIPALLNSISKNLKIFPYLIFNCIVHSTIQHYTERDEANHGLNGPIVPHGIDARLLDQISAILLGVYTVAVFYNEGRLTIIGDTFGLQVCMSYFKGGGDNNIIEHDSINTMNDSINTIEDEEKLFNGIILVASCICFGLSEWYITNQVIMYTQTHLLWHLGIFHSIYQIIEVY